MTEKKFTASITEVTISTGKSAFVEINVDGKSVRVPVSPEFRAYFNEQFVRPTPTPAQRKKFATLLNPLRAAYVKGQSDGK